MTIIGDGEYRYSVSGDDWGDLPEGWSYKEATSVAVDANDNVYVFNRGEHPVIVLDRNGAVINSWGEGVFTSAHGAAIGPDESLYCIDAADHTVRKFTLDGKLLMTLGEKGRGSGRLSGQTLQQPDPRGRRSEHGRYIRIRRVQQRRRAQVLARRQATALLGTFRY